MELLTLAAIIAGIIAVIIGLIVVIKKISAFYKQRFQFSIWSGVLLLVVALALLLISSADGTTQQTVYVMLVIAAILALLTIYNDIRLAGVAWGGLAVLLQIIFALSFVFLIIFALIGFVMKKLFNIHSSLLASIFGGLGIKGELLLLLHFLHISRSSESVIGGIIVALIGAGLAFWGAKINEKSSSEFG